MQLNKYHASMKDEIKAWRDELDIKNKALGIKALMNAARDNDAKAVNAAKYLTEKGYISKRGRPSAEEVERERKQAVGLNKELDKDIERLGIKVVQGGK